MADPVVLLVLVVRVSYREQALFSLVSLPFSFKLLWAPIVDSTRLPPFGRRKSWLVPVQLLCGLLMLAATPLIPTWMGEAPPPPAAGAATPAPSPSASPPNVPALTAYFFSLYLLMATQDIAVDGWALTMLSPQNVGHASTCNTIGQTLGYSLAHVGFLALNSAETCNRFLRATPRPYGMVSLAGFMWFWGWVFLGTTLLVLCKAEAPPRTQRAPHLPRSGSRGKGLGGDGGLLYDDEGGGLDHHHQQQQGGGGGAACLSVLSTYRQLVQILRLPSVQSMCLVLLTVKLAFAPIDSATNLKVPPPADTPTERDHSP